MKLLRRASPFFLTVAGLLVAAPAVAHDFWVVPAELVMPEPKEAKVIDVSLYVGEHFVAESEKPFQRDRLVTFQHVHGGKRDDLLSAKPALFEDGKPPLARLPVQGAGGHLLAMDRVAINIELTAPRFDDYLAHEGLGHLVTERARLGEREKPGRERYSRYLKTLIQVGDARDDSFKEVTGAALELVPEQNPVFVESGATLPVQIRFRGQPLPGVRLEALSRDGADIRSAMITADGAGIARVPIDRKGVWLLRMVHMVRCEGCPDADWESFWTSYTFGSWRGSGATVAAPSMMAAPSGPSWKLIAAAALGAIAVAFGGSMWRRRAMQRGA